MSSLLERLVVALEKIADNGDTSRQYTEAELFPERYESGGVYDKPEIPVKEYRTFL